MRRLDTVSPHSLPEDLLQAVADAEKYMGFVANDILLLAWKPEILRAAGPFMRAIYRDDLVSFELKRLIGMMASWAAGCQYCVAHTGHGASLLGVPESKIAALPQFESDPAFSASERAALRVALGASRMPSEVTDAEWAELRSHYSNEQVIEIMAVIGMFGFLNRFNATLQTELESSPLNFARRSLSATGWTAGRHAQD